MIQNTDERFAASAPLPRIATLPSLVHHARLRATLKFCLGEEDVAASCIGERQKVSCLPAKECSRGDAHAPFGSNWSSDMNVSLTEQGFVPHLRRTFMNASFFSAVRGRRAM